MRCDYAQMADFSGYPEIGALSLLYFRAGGRLREVLRWNASRTDNGTVRNIFVPNSDVDGNCGCGMPSCGYHLPCFVPFGTEDSMPIIKALTTRWESTTSEMLRFWSNEQNEESLFRPLSPLVQVLLLKLLYCSPIGGPFVRLACESVEHMRLNTRRMDEKYKSHWAYYVLIRSLVEGWKVKPHRRNTVVPYHVPVKDILSGEGRRTKFGGKPLGKDVLNEQTSAEYWATQTDHETNSGDFGALASYLESVLDHCSRNMEATTTTTTTRLSVAAATEEMITRATTTHVRLRPFLCARLPHPPLYLIGDSHVVSLAWQTVHVSRDGDGGALRTAVPYPATGIKARHVAAPSDLFFTRYNLRVNLSRSSSSSSSRSVVLSAGEIDCREGIGGELLRGHVGRSSDALVRAAVRSYVAATRAAATDAGLQILLLPVAPHAYRSDRNGKALGRARRRERIELWNRALREEIERTRNNAEHVFLLDYEERLRETTTTTKRGDGDGPVLNRHFNADYTHMNSAFLPLLEDAIVNCGCDLSLL